uniref:RNA-binding protein 25-like n=1 Tax=Myxine glutinosa TaxID=7769 RepID=UPI00358E7A73
MANHLCEEDSTSQTERDRQRDKDRQMYRERQPKRDSKRKETERQRDRETGRDRETERERDTQSDRDSKIQRQQETQRDRQRQTEIETARDRDRERQRETVRETHRDTERQRQQETERQPETMGRMGKRDKLSSPERKEQKVSLAEKFKKVFQKTRPKEQTPNEPSPSTSNGPSTSTWSKWKFRKKKKHKEGRMEVLREECKTLQNEERTSSPLHEELGLRDPGASGATLHESEFQMMFTDEHKCCQHKMNYVIQKKEYNRLQQAMNDRKETLTKLEQEVEYYREGCNLLSKENCLRQTQLNLQQQNNTKELEKIQLKYETEMAQLREECGRLQQKNTKLKTIQSRHETEMMDCQVRCNHELQRAEQRIMQSVDSLQSEKFLLNQRLIRINQKLEDEMIRFEREKRKLEHKLVDVQAAFITAQLAHQKQMEKDEKNLEELKRQLSSKIFCAEQETRAQHAKMEELEHVYKKKEDIVHGQFEECVSLKSQQNKESEDAMQEQHQFNERVILIENENAKNRSQLQCISTDEKEMEEQAKVGHNNWLSHFS